MSTYPRTFSHIGISVPDVEKAVEFLLQCYGLVSDNETDCNYRRVRYTDRTNVY